MKALTVESGRADSARLEDVSEPEAPEGAALVAMKAVGVCGTDREIVGGGYGEPPPGRARLVLGHESVGEVLEAPPGSGLSAGQLVVGIVRRPDPVPCPACAAGEWDMCLNGRYSEHGIKGLDGFARERYRVDPAGLVPVPASLGERAVLVETASIVAKGWEQIGLFGLRFSWRPRRAIVTGAGPVGLMAALMGRQRGLEVHVLDRQTAGPKPSLVRALGAEYHAGSLEEIGPADVIVECTGAGEVVLQALRGTRAAGVVCLAGLSTRGRAIPVDASRINASLVLENEVVFGTVNANRRHYLAAIVALRAADPAWLDGVVARRAPLSRWAEALERRPGDVKTILVPG